MDGNKKTKGENLIKSEKEMLKDSNFWEGLFRNLYDRNNAKFISIDDVIEAWEYADYLNFDKDTMIAERPFSKDFEKICDAVAEGLIEYKKENSKTLI